MDLEIIPCKYCGGSGCWDCSNQGRFVFVDDRLVEVDEVVVTDGNGHYYMAEECDEFEDGEGTLPGGTSVFAVNVVDLDR